MRAGRGLGGRGGCGRGAGRPARSAGSTGLWRSNHRCRSGAAVGRHDVEGCEAQRGGTRSAAWSAAAPSPSYPPHPSRSFRKRTQAEFEGRRGVVPRQQIGRAAVDLHLLHASGQTAFRAIQRSRGRGN